jgi:hypothetical protein
MNCVSRNTLLKPSVPRIDLMSSDIKLQCRFRPGQHAKASRVRRQLVRRDECDDRKLVFRRKGGHVFIIKSFIEVWVHLFHSSCYILLSTSKLPTVKMSTPKL